MIYNEFIDAGFRVFALWPIVGGKCGCGDPRCEAVGKHPRVANWQHTPEWSDDQIEAMEESGQFETGYAVLVAGNLVIDIDERNGGARSYERLAERFPEIASAGLVVRTGSGGASKHLYFTLPEPAPLVQHHDDYPGIDFKSSGYVVGPGSLHASGNQYEVLLGSPHEVDQAPASLVELLRKPDRHRGTVNGTAMDVSDGDLREMMAAIPNTDSTDYEVFIRIGMAIHLVTNGEGYDLWDEWAAKGPKYNPKDMPKKWHSFGKASNPVTLGTLVHYAEEAGWRPGVTFEATAEFDLPRESPALDEETVDLLRPPGFVGELAAWINRRNRHPREHLAVAGALSVISAVAGMRYIDPLDGITPNIFLFGVSGSATGKESILKSVQELLRVAGVAAASHGAIKSEQEIYRNLIRHQAAIYVIDELGEQLAKIQNARARGTTAYLEGVIGALLSLYSKADGYALITGDLKEEVRKAMQAELASLNKQLEGGNGDEKTEIRYASLVHQLGAIDNGLPNPYLTMFGLTTPERFDTIMDFDMAANGFMGRSLIFRELNDNPKAKPRRKIERGTAPDAMAATLQQLYAPGHSEVPDRVERIGELAELPTRPDAMALLEEIEEQFWEMAETVKEKTGLTAIPRRGYEQVAKVSFLLGIPEGMRTSEHVRWAYALVKRDIDEKIKLAHSNSAADKADALASRIMSHVTEDHGETLGRLRNKCRAYRKADVDECIKRLVEAGHLVCEKTQPKRGRPTEKYFAVNV